MLVSSNLSLPEVMFVRSRRFLLINTVNVGQFLFNKTKSLLKVDGNEKLGGSGKRQ